MPDETGGPSEAEKLLPMLEGVAAVIEALHGRGHKLAPDVIASVRKHTTMIHQHAEEMRED